MRRHWSNSRGIRIPPTQTGSGPAPPPIVPPDSISGLALWTDPSDLSTVNARGSGTANTYPLVTLDDKASGVGGRVGGPSNPIAVPPFFSSQYWSCAATPVGSTTINGRTAMSFTGSEYGVLRTIVNGTTSQRMHNQTPGVGADGLVINSESVTVIAVVDPVGGGWPASGAYNTYDLPGMFDLSAGWGPGAYIYGTAAAGNKGIRVYKFTNPGTGDHYVNDSTLQGFVAGGPTVLVWRQQDPGPAPNASFLYGGVSLNLSANPLQTTTSQLYRSYLTYWQTKPMYLGFGYGYYAACKIGEFCVWDRALSDAEIQSLQPYFNQQWGV